MIHVYIYAVNNWSLTSYFDYLFLSDCNPGLSFGLISNLRLDKIHVQNVGICIEMPAHESN
jgi:hypothetical protein